MADLDEPIDPDFSTKPFYLTVDFDGDHEKDHAIVIRGKRSNKLGLLICRDEKQVVVFGPISKPKVQLSSFEDDNFLSDSWGVLTKNETRTAALDGSGRSRIGDKSKGEAIGFYHEGGSLYIFWDGQEFKLVEGG